MVEDREQWLAETFIDLADTLVEDFDLLELLTILVERCVVLLDAAEVGLVIMNGDHLAVMASSTERMRAIELFEIQQDEGPCVESLRSGRPVDFVTLDDATARRWPRFDPEARQAGYRAVMALPLRLRARGIGAVNAFFSHVDAPPEANRRLAQALADAATIAILQQRLLADSAVVVGQLQAALESRVAIEQAKGMVAEQNGVEVGEAFWLIRNHARVHNVKILDVAAAIITRDITL